jgi:hypothetical protein
MTTYIVRIYENDEMYIKGVYVSIFYDTMDEAMKLSSHCINQGLIVTIANNVERG